MLEHLCVIKIIFLFWDMCVFVDDSAIFRCSGLRFPKHTVDLLWNTDETGEDSPSMAQLPLFQTSMSENFWLLPECQGILGPLHSQICWIANEHCTAKQKNILFIILTQILFLSYSYHKTQDKTDYYNNQISPCREEFFRCIHRKRI